MSICTLCPRQCGIDRPLSVSDNGPFGVCGMGTLPVIARAAPHFGEEPCISGTRGSGAIFFSGCALSCVFCQNHPISGGDRFGREVTVDRLRAIFWELIEAGVHNINLVNPTHFIPAIAKALEEKLPVPVVYNTGGYDRVESLRLLEGKVDIYLPDMKYRDKARSTRYSAAPDYPEVAAAAITEMVRQVGPLSFDDDGMLRRGVMIRHLVMPGGLDDARRVIDWIADRFSSDEVMVSLMSQYTPTEKTALYPEIHRRLTTREYTRAAEHLALRGITNGYLQERDSASSAYIPPFDLTGV